jgi:hypothetical protein
MPVEIAGGSVVAQHRRSQSIGLFLIVVFSAVFLWALAAVAWPVPVVHADGPPEILTITVTSGLETYFYDPGLDPTGGTVYFNSVGGEGGGQVITVTTAVSGSIPITLTGAAAFGMTPTPDTNSTGQLSITYTIGVGAGTENGVLFTVTDSVGFTDTAVISFTQDNAVPTVVSPTLNDYDNFFLHADGLTLYYGDDMVTAVFSVEGEAQDDGAGPDQTTYSYAFEGTPGPDVLSPPSYSWAGLYTVEPKDYGSGPITVTVSDKVGNSAIQVFTYTRDIISPTIVPTAISETSPYLHADGLTLYYSDLMGGSAQEFEVQGTASDDTEGAGFRHVAFSPAFGDSPVTSTLWSGIYDVVSSNNGDGNIEVTAYDNVGNWSTGVFTYVEDLLNPTVVITDVTDPGYDSAGDELDDDGSNWYKASNFTAGGSGWEFHYNTADDGGAGLASGFAFWDHSNDMDDRQIPELDLDGDDVFNDVDDDGDGMVTVTVTISDNVGNLANGVVVLNIDNTGPVITSPSIYDYESPWLHVNGLNVYYGNDMPGPQSFRVQGESTDGTGVGLDRATFSEAFGNPPPFDDTTPITWTAHYYPDGQNWGNGTIIVTVYDLLDNPATQVFTYTRDTGNPSSVASSPQYDNGSPIVVTYTNAGDTGGSGLREVELWYKKEVTGTWTNSGLLAQTGFSGTFNFIPTGDGAYYFASMATDNVGNREDTPTGSGDDATIYDTIAPSVPMSFTYQLDSDSGGDGFWPEAGYYDDTVVDLEWEEPSTEEGSGLPANPYHLGTAPQPTGGSYAEDSSYDVGSSGTYSIYLTAEDNAGNISDDTVTGPVVVDLEAPQVNNVNCPSATGQLSFPVSWSATDPGSGLGSTDPYSVSYKVDGDPWQSWITATSATMATFGPTSPVTVEYEQTYCFHMRAVDKAGNVESTSGSDCTVVSETLKLEQVFLPIIMAPDQNWGFELGNFTYWQHGGQLAQSVSTAMPHSGSYSALLGSPSYACNYGVPVGSAWLRRSVTVPSSGSPTLSFWYRIYTQDKNTGLSDQYDLFAVYINGSQLVVKDANISDPYGCSMTPPYKNLGWKPVNFSLDAYKGQTIEITFYNYNRPDRYYNTYTYVDDVSVQ